MGCDSLLYERLKANKTGLLRDNLFWVEFALLISLDRMPLDMIQNYIINILKFLLDKGMSCI